MNTAQQARFNEALTAQQVGKINQAESVYKELLGEDPDTCEAHHMLALVHLQRRSYREALRFAEKETDIDRDNAKYLNTLGSTQMEVQDYSPAIDSFLSALSIEPDFVDARFNLGIAFQRQGNRDKAEFQYRQVLEQRPNDAGALNNLAMLLSATGRIDEAILNWKAAHAAEPDEPEKLCNLVNYLERTNQLTQAQTLGTKLINLVPRAAVSNIITARIARRMGEFTVSKRRLEEVIRTTKSQDYLMRAYFELGHTLDWEGEAQEAFRVFEVANKTAVSRSASLDTKHRSFRRRLTAWHRAVSHKSMQDLLSRQAETINLEDSPEAVPIFLVGFPRSGTTLLERMFDAHPDLVTTEERSPIRTH